MFIYIIHEALLLPTSMKPVKCAFARSMLALPSSSQNPLKITGDRTLEQ